MNYLKLSFAFFILSLSINLNVSAQQDSTILGNILGKSKIVADQYPAEKVYLHFDKPYYSVADTIFFKAYLTFEQNVPSPLSKVVYVDLMTSQDSLVQTIKLPVTNSVAYGSIPLDMVNFKQGNYYVRAYTVWMFNSSPDYFFTKTIAIGEAIDKKLITHFTYKNIQNEKGQTIEAQIQYKNTDKIPYISRNVSWSVTSNYEVVSKGKGVTDQNGVLKITITPKKNQVITKGDLVTELTAGTDVFPSSFVLKPKAANNDVQFFPEGGELIRSIPTQIGFKAINSAGLGIALTGTVTDNEGNQISTFTSSHLGMGSFYVNAEGDKFYKANVTFKDGTKKSFDLPKSIASGISIQAASLTPDMINFKIVANDTYFQENQGKGLYIVAQKDGRVYYAAQSKLAAQVTTAKVSTEKFPPGIIQMTLFSSTGEPVSERLFFVLHKNPVMNLTLKSDLPTYKPRQKVKLTVSAKDSLQHLVGDFSISVTDLQKVPVDENSETTILSSLLLTSDLKGFVEHPNYYFIKTDEKKRAELDILMLTQGYRRFSYKELLANKFPPVNFTPEQGITVTGTLRDRTGMPVKKAALRLTSPGRLLSAEAITTNLGLFSFPKLVFEDGAELLLNAKYNGAGNNMMIMVDSAPMPEVTGNPNIADEVTNIDSTMSAYLDNSKKQYSNLRTLKEVKIVSAPVKKPSHADHPALSGLSMMADHEIGGDRFQDCNDLLTCLKTMAMGLTFEDNNFYITRDYMQGNKSTPVQIFINGNAVDAISVNSVNPKDVESVEIFLQDQLGLVFKTYNCKGVLVINTKKVEKSNITLADLKKMLPQNNMIKFTPKGYTKVRDFYSPKYLTQTSSYTGNDLRSTIYWNPKVITNATGDTVVEYFNADGKGTYRAVIEGVDVNGNVGRFVYRYTVK